MIKPVAGKITKGELRSQGSRSLGRPKERSGQVSPKVPVNGINEQVKSVEEATERHRMTVKERKELPITCTHYGRPLARPQV